MTMIIPRKIVQIIDINAIIDNQSSSIILPFRIAIIIEKTSIDIVFRRKSEELIEFWQVWNIIIIRNGPIHAKIILRYVLHAFSTDSNKVVYRAMHSGANGSAYAMKRVSTA